MHSFSDVFERVKEVCRGEMSEVAYNLWIDKLELTDMDSSTARLICSTEFMREIINEKYNALLTAAFEQTMGFPVKVEILSWETAAVRQPPAPPKKTEFIPEKEYSFETFVVGSGNSLAHAAAWAVANNPAKSYNPLFLHGGSGLGKTHLIYAICGRIRQNHPDYKLLYVKGEEFANELILAIRNGTTAEFKEKYRQADLLAVDDIQFIAGKIQTQEEFFHTFNTLYESGKQIVLTSDRPPREMTQLEDRLRTRFEWGLMVDVAPPDFETRLAIIQIKAAALGVKLPAEVSDYIAENVTSNVRQLEGTLNKILAYRDLLGDQVDEEAVGRAVRDMLLKSNEYVPSPKIIISYVAKYYHLDEDTIRGQSRGRDVVTARQVAIYLIRRMNGLPMNDIGKEFGDRDHSTIMHSLEKVESQMRSDPAFAETVKEITTNINNKR